MSTKRKPLWGTISIIILWLIGALCYPKELMVYRPSDFLNGQWWRALTYLCANEHIIFLVIEIIVFVALGWALEKEYGTGRFVVLYFTVGVAGALIISLCFMRFDVTIVGSSSMLSLFSAFYYTRVILHHNQKIHLYSGVVTLTYMIGILAHHIYIGKSIFLLLYPFVIGIVMGMMSGYRSIWGKENDMKLVGYNPLGDFLVHCKGTFLIMITVIFVYTWSLVNYQVAEILLFQKEMILNGQWWRMIFNRFLPDNLWNLFITLVMLLLIGRRLERKTGTFMFLMIYILTGITSNLVNWLPIVYMGDTNGTFISINGLLIFLFMMIFSKESRMKIDPKVFLCMMAYLILHNIGQIEGGMFTNHLLGFIVGFVLYVVLATIGDLLSKRERLTKNQFAILEKIRKG